MKFYIDNKTKEIFFRDTTRCAYLRYSVGETLTDYVNIFKGYPLNSIYSLFFKLPVLKVFQEAEHNWHLDLLNKLFSGKRQSVQKTLKEYKQFKVSMTYEYIEIEGKQRFVEAYETSFISVVAHIELMKSLQLGIKIRKCKRCGDFYVVSKNSKDICETCEWAERALEARTTTNATPVQEVSEPDAPLPPPKSKGVKLKRVKSNADYKQ